MNNFCPSRKSVLHHLVLDHPASKFDEEKNSINTRQNDQPRVKRQAMNKKFEKQVRFFSAKKKRDTIKTFPEPSKILKIEECS